MRLSFDPHDLDIAGLGTALKQALWASTTNPAPTVRASMRLAGDLAAIPAASIAHWLDHNVEPTTTGDRRFADPTWTTNPFFCTTRLAYLAASRFARDVVASAPLEPAAARKAVLATDLLLAAAAPTNLLPLNPTALKHAFDTGGMSLVRSARNVVDDLVNNGGRPRQVDAAALQVGRDLAVTPAKVVHRNGLMELLQYEPQTERVHAVPVLCSPPWINKYYVMDLAPGRSFIEWAVRQGRTVFAISYLNPSAEIAATTMDDYLRLGPRAALDVVCDITGADTVDVVGLCLGGALGAITAAHLAQAGDDRVGTLTLLNTMLDYTEPGALGAFTDAAAVARLERRTAGDGVLPAESMAATFDALRAQDLVFDYVVSNWLMGRDPPAFDILAWNADGTRLPAAMHGSYLRDFYVDNKLAAGSLEIGGAVVDLGAITASTYVVSAVNDHIVPWESAYRSVGLVGGPVRFVLGGGGHIAGVVSPPGPKAWHAVADGPDDATASAQDWRAAARRRVGSWWEDWVRWSAATAGPLREPPPTGSREHPVLDDGPGLYVRT